MTTHSPQLPSAAEMTERLATWIERYRIPGASMAWMHGDEVQCAAAGVVNINTGAAATPETLFQIGSITKIYTTTLIMQLVDEGRINLDAPARTYLPDLRFIDDEATRTVTIRQLLTHTSGVDGDFFEDFGRGDDCVEKYVAACANLPQVFPPGSLFSYCNAGFVVLGRIIELMTGMSWDAALRTRVLDPIGARQSVTLPEQALLHSTAAGHTVDAKLQIALAPVWNLPRSTGPAGATPCMTAADLLTFAKMHLSGGFARDGARVLSDESVRAMQSVQFDLPPVPGEGAAHWGLGWMLFDWGGRRVFGHDGGTVGQNSSLRILPRDDVAVAVLTNSAGGALLASRVMRWIYGQALGIEMPDRPKPPETPSDVDVSPYAGVYERLSMRIEVTKNDGRLSARYINTGPLAAVEAFQLPPMDLVPVQHGLFLERNPLLGAYQPVTFTDFEDGRPRYLHATRVARRVD